VQNEGEGKCTAIKETGGGGVLRRGTLREGRNMKEGRCKGRKDGRKEGRKEGRKDGRKDGMKT
jgi:hypothetical protein